MPGSKRPMRYPGDFKEFDYSPRTSKAGIAICQAKIRQLKRKLRNLQEKTRRQAKRIVTLKGLMQDLKNKFALPDHAVASMEVSF